MRENLNLNFTIKKRIHTNLFMDGAASLFYGGWSDFECGEGGQPLVLVDPQIEYTACYKVPQNA